ncbi:MAG: heparin lyase I family protein [Armatimonadota bacterium]|nr:heparin lyase I family protein [Armatimonadota bacterium]
MLTALDAAWAEWQRSRLYQRWRQANPGEAAKLEAYRAGGPRPELATPAGRALVLETDAWLAERGAVVPAHPGVPTFHVREPLGREDSHSTSTKLYAHWWTTTKSKRLERGEYWVIGAYRFAPDFPTFQAWAACWNFHTLAEGAENYCFWRSKDQGGSGWGVSPVRLMVMDGLLSVHYVGGGTMTNLSTCSITGVRTGYLPNPRPPMLRGQWTDWVLHLYLHPQQGFVELWQRGQLVVPRTQVPTMYDGQVAVGLWAGFYAPAQADPSWVAEYDLELPRIGATFAEAWSDVPVVASEWGALTYDPTTVTPLPSRDLARQFVLPPELARW